jgi:hypothetical protein
MGRESWALTKAMSSRNGFETYMPAVSIKNRRLVDNVTKVKAGKLVVSPSFPFEIDQT